MNRNTLYILIGNSLCGVTGRPVFTNKTFPLVPCFMLTPFEVCILLYISIGISKQTNKQINTTSTPPPAPLHLHIKLTTQKIYRVYSVSSNRPLGIVFTYLWPSMRNSLLLTGLSTPSSDNCGFNNVFFLQGLLGSHSYLYTNPPLSINPPKTLEPTIIL